MSGLIVSKSSIITGICNGNINSIIDVEQFFDKLEINDSIIGAKFHGRLRGTIVSSGSFYNQITLVVYSEETEKQVNVKLFGNGNLQFSGIKSILHAESAIKIILKQLLVTFGEEKVITKVSDNIIYDNLDYCQFNDGKIKKRFEIIKIYSYPDAFGKIKVIGNKKCSDFIINNEICIVEGEYFVSSKFINLTKKIFNKSGEEIGYDTYQSKYKRKNVIIKGRIITEESENIFIVTDKYGNISGKIIRTFFNKEKNLEKITDGTREYLISYDCLSKEYKKNMGPVENAIKNMNICISNLNMKFNISYENNTFDRSEMHNIFSKHQYITSYYNEDSDYQGLSIKLYYDANDVLTTNIPKKSRKVSVTIFSSGSILVSGCTIKKEMILAKSDIVNVLSVNLDNIIKKNKMIVDIVNKNLTIWDII
mgnify:CR=1 FL=1|jgi:TATA-box binding protein (TBP) (component of TFIID and TFIIIB)